MTTITEAHLEKAALDWLAAPLAGGWPTDRTSLPIRPMPSATTTSR